MNSENQIITSEEYELNKIPLDPKYLLGYTTNVYGKSGSGKTILLNNCLKELSKYVNIAFIFSGTEKTDPNFSKNFPQQLIYHELSSEMLNKIRSYQQMRTDIFNRAHDYDTLKSLYQYINSPMIDTYITKIKRKLKRAAYLPEDKKYEYEEKCKLKLHNIYIEAIKKHRHFLRKQNYNYTEEQSICLKYITINPHAVVIIDDLSAEIQELYRQDKQLLQNIFFKDRHINLTFLIAVHCESTFLPALRTNAHNSIFTSEDLASTFFSRKSNGISKSFSKIAQSCIDDVFSIEGKKEHRKLVFTKNPYNKKELHYVVPKKIIKYNFCSDQITNYCRAVSRKSQKTDTSNPFYEAFK